jgi:hypothetical protein
MFKSLYLQVLFPYDPQNIYILSIIPINGGIL